MLMLAIQPHVEQKFNQFNPSYVPFSTSCWHDHKMEKNVTGVAIKEALSALRKSQRWLSERIGVSDNAVSKWVKTGQVDKKYIPLLSEVLNVRIEVLIGLSPATGHQSALANEPPIDQPTAVVDSGIDARMLLSHVEMLRKSAQIIAESFGLSADQVLASAMAPVTAKPAGDDEMRDAGRYLPPEPRGPAIRTSTQNVDSAYQWESAPEDSKADQDRRREERRARDRRAS